VRALFGNEQMPGRQFPNNILLDMATHFGKNGHELLLPRA